jgi:hypothetical protein
VINSIGSVTTQIGEHSNTIDAIVQSIPANILSRSCPGGLFGLCPRAHHLARGKDQRGGPRVPQPHDHRGKAGRSELCISSLNGDLLEVKLAVQIHLQGAGGRCGLQFMLTEACVSNIEERASIVDECNVCMCACVRACV